MWQGGHCADEMAVTTGAGSVAVRDAAALGSAVVAATVTVHGSGHGSGHDHGPARPDRPGSTADTCDIVRATTVSTTATASVSLAAELRAVAATPRPQLLRQRVLPAVTLAHLGVSRT
jgi:hypothetical protein